MNILQTFENGFHAISVDPEKGITSLITSLGGVVTLHHYFQTGEMVAQTLNLPILREILTAVDSLVPPAQA